MEEEEPTESVFGLPFDWDGHPKRQYQFFVTAVEDIEDDGWEYIFGSTNLGWVITPHRSQYAPHDVG